jgi:L-rhamnose mutarotase
MPDNATERVCFVLHVRPDRVDEYVAAHEHVWPEMLGALSRAGWHNYSLFVRPDDGLVIGYLETDDFAAAQSRMAATEVNARGQAGMADFFQNPAGVLPDEAMKPLTEYFHLD